MSDIDKDSIFGSHSNDGGDGGSIRSIETLNRSKSASGSRPPVTSESIASSSQEVRIHIGHANIALVEAWFLGIKCCRQLGC